MFKGGRSECAMHEFLSERAGQLERLERSARSPDECFSIARLVVLSL